MDALMRSYLKGLVLGSGIATAITLCFVIAYAADILTIDKDGAIRFRVSDTGKVTLNTTDTAQGDLRFTPRAIDPTAPLIGDFWYNSTERKFKFNDGAVRTLSIVFLNDLAQLVDDANTASNNDGIRGSGSSYGTDDPSWTQVAKLGGSALCFDGVNDIVTFTSSILTGNLLANPGFETGDLTGWTGDGDVRNYSPIVGTYSAGYDIDSYYVQQDADVSSYGELIDAGIVLSDVYIWSKNGGVEEGDGARVRLRYLDAGNNVLAEYDTGVFATAGPAKYGDSRTVPVGTRKIRVWAQGIEGGSSNADVYFDTANVSLTATPSSLSSIKTIEFWINDVNSSDGVMELVDNTKYISIAGGSIVAFGFAAPTIYVNGSSASQTLAAGWNHVVITTGTGVAAPGLNLGEANGDYLIGYLDEVAIWSSALTSADVIARYNGGKGAELQGNEAGLVSVWHLNDPK